MGETTTRCNQVGCDLPATHRVFWPGKPPAPTCVGHERIAVGIGRAMGLHVHSEQLEATEGECPSNR